MRKPSYFNSLYTHKVVYGNEVCPHEPPNHPPKRVAQTYNLEMGTLCK